VGQNFFRCVNLLIRRNVSVSTPSAAPGSVSSRALCQREAPLEAAMRNLDAMDLGARPSRRGSCAKRKSFEPAGRRRLVTSRPPGRRGSAIWHAQRAVFLTMSTAGQLGESARRIREEWRVAVPRRSSIDRASPNIQLKGSLDLTPVEAVKSTAHSSRRLRSKLDHDVFSSFL